MVVNEQKLIRIVANKTKKSSKTLIDKKKPGKVNFEKQTFKTICFKTCKEMKKNI